MADVRPLRLNPDRLFPADPVVRSIARALYASVRDLPIVSPHGHTDPAWFATDAPFAGPGGAADRPRSLRFPDALQPGRAAARRSASPPSTAARPSRIRAGSGGCSPNIIICSAARPRGSGSTGCSRKCSGSTSGSKPATADLYYETIDAALKTDAFRPRALFDRFGIELIATTESPLDPLDHHRAIRSSGWQGRVVTAYRPDPVMDPDFPGFADNLVRFGEMTGEEAGSYAGYLRAHEKRRAAFREMGATSTDHGHPSAFTADLPARRGRSALRQDPCGRFHPPGGRAVPRPDADRDGADEHRGRDGDAAPPGRGPQPQCGFARPLRPRQGRRHSGPDRLCRAR